SRLATAALAAVILTGTYQTWDRLQHFADLWQTSYGRHLLLKLALVLVMIGLGAINRFFHLPGLLAGHDRSAAARHFSRIIYVEAGVALLVILATAALIQTSPPHHHMDM
ncbi:MAG TPA: CopD family protein, partial [Nitrococcus sp.]|nr:CopD family protein [Nitrococcus sp.]